MGYIQFSSRSFKTEGALTRCGVVVCTLSTRNYSSDFADARENAVIHGILNGIAIHSLTVKSSVISLSRNFCIGHSLRRKWNGKKPDHLLFLDDDMTFPMDIISRLVEVSKKHDAAIVGVLATARTPPFKICVLDRKLKNYTLGETLRLHRKKAALQVGAVGMACTLIRFSLLEGMKPPYFSQNYKVDEVIEILEALEKSAKRKGAVPAKKIRAAIEALRCQYVSEDYGFCLRAAKSGAKVVCDFGVSTPGPDGEMPGIGHIDSRVFSLLDTERYLAREGVRNSV